MLVAENFINGQFQVDSLEGQLTFMVTQNNQKDEEIRSLNNKINTLEANQNTPKIIFSGVRRNHASSNSDLTFDQAIVNIGQGFDPATGTFKSPVSGIYQFSFSAVTDRKGTSTSIKVFKNNACFPILDS